MADKKQSLARRDPFADLESWDPFGMLSLRARLPRWTDEFFGEQGGSGRLLAPAIDVSESEDAYDISVEVAGVKKDDLVVECKDGVLSIRGEKKSERDEKKSSARILERTYGAFSRSLSLPADADPDKVEATYRDGVLHIALRKRPEAKARSVAIKG